MTLLGNTLLRTGRLCTAAGLLAMSATGYHASAAEWPHFKESLKAFPTIDLAARQSKGQDAIDRLGLHLPDVASWYGRTPDQLRKELLNDRRMRVDKSGRVLFVEELEAPIPAEQIATAAAQEGIQQGALVSLDQTFYLHSHPGATRTIYLDFNGARITGTAWNSNGNTINAAPFDIDGNPASFSTSELQRIQYIWQRVAEDYAPFDVDVTTEQPTQDVLTRSSVNDQVYGTTVVITKTDGVYSCNCGGIAYVGVFNYAGGSHTPDYYKPAFVFFDKLGAGNEKVVAEAISHEAGHNMGLHHDGTASDPYYGGQGSDPTTGWAPIMGVGYYKPLVQFSRGEYAGANNKEDDFVVAQTYGLPMRLDDFGSVIEKATPFVEYNTGGMISGSMDGIIESMLDRDVFAISAGPGPLNATVIPAMRSPNTDLVLTLRDAAGNVLASTNPLNQLSSVLYYSVPAQGTYYLEVMGTGQGDAIVNGYSNYGSVGNFRLSANYSAPLGSRPTAVMAATLNNGPAPLAVSFNGLGSQDDGRIAFWYWDFGDGNSDVTGTLSAPTHVYSVPGSYIARLTVVDDSGLSASTTQVINVTKPSPQTSVQAIQITLKSNSRGYAWATAVVSVVNQNGTPMRSARVSASWNGIVSKTTGGLTRTAGTLTLNSPRTKLSGCFNLTINGITAKGYLFNAASYRTAQVCR
jgi:PKD repeat protein